MEVIHHEKVHSDRLHTSAIADTYLTFIKIKDVRKHAESLISEITNTSWISNLDPIAKMSYEDAAKETIDDLVKKFNKVDNKVTKDFGEFMISLSSGISLREKEQHQILPISELWKEKMSNNHGFDFHTISTSDKYSFGEAKYVCNGNSYTSAADQIVDFMNKRKDRRDAVHLQHLGSPIALKNLKEGRRGFIVAFSINSEDYATILDNSLDNKDIIELTKECDELYIIGVQV